ncbi:hypothetical protein BKA61DRAFT_719361 [Leptodontidium sp. MPI-SDFR-AT-0119]|nr:hypothetical protein BKA61DRAFT_719361 [Leptodontidium sp. MPI-SDFR-AT-0119]
MPWLRPSLKNSRIRRKRAHKILFGGREIKTFLVACSPHSAILLVNHEARKIGLKFYAAVNLVGPGHRPVMANLNVDYLAPVERRCTSLESLELSLQTLRCIMKPKKLHRVAIPGEIWERIDKMLNDRQSMLANMQCFFDIMKWANDITDIMLLAEGRVFSTRKSIGVRKPKVMNTWLYYRDLRGSEFKVRGPEVTIEERERQLRSSIERARTGWRIRVHDNASKLYRFDHAASPAAVLHSYRNLALGWEIPNFLIGEMKEHGEYDTKKREQTISRDTQPRKSSV